jgi:hypothetical protein
MVTVFLKFSTIYLKFDTVHIKFGTDHPKFDIKIRSDHVRFFSPYQIFKHRCRLLEFFTVKIMVRKIL